MSGQTSLPRVIRFGEFEVDLQAGCLLRQGVKVRLREQLLLALSTLLEHPGAVVTREELQKRLWPADVLVDFELNLNTIIARLREALGDSADQPRYIETLPKRGYRFLAAVSEAPVAEAAPPHRVRLVVLPFANVGGDPAEEYFSDSLTDEMITALCQMAPERLAVIARTTAMHYKNSSKDVTRIGRELKVDYVVEGGVHRSDGRLTMNVQLIQVSDQTHVFARKYEAEMTDLFGLQTQIAKDLASCLPFGCELPEGGGARKRPTEDLQAYQLYLQGRYQMGQLIPPHLARARESLEAAIARDPRFALAYDALAEVYWWTSFYGYTPPRQACFVGLGLALRAIEIDPSLGEAHAQLGRLRQKLDYNWAEVLREMTRAMELAPSSPLVLERYAVSYLLPLAKLDEALAQVEQALELDPLSPHLHMWLSCFLWLKRDYDRALPAARFFVEIDPENYMAHFMVGNILRDSGRFAESVAPMRLCLEFGHGAPAMMGWLAMNLAKSGEVGEAREWLARIQAAAAKAYVSPTSFVMAYVGLGEYDEALTWIERAIDERDSIIIPIKTYAFFDPLRADPRFQACVRRMNLEP
ncbi:MAG TPA: winged helix-turn-helix domain-containing protein [Acidobacteriota bacterium]|nr:winged helix-turn-helix domain-containing protein [Acidobacteriota bacterium]